MVSVPPHDSVFLGGLDEAGRGAVIGPLVVSLVWFDQQALKRLDSLRVRDSKAFGSSPAARHKRALLADEIRLFASGSLLATAQALEVDQAVEASNLNALERRLAETLLRQMPSSCRVIADGQRIFGPLHSLFPSLEAFNKADADHSVVSAASIVAKNERDRLVEEILGEYEAVFGKIRGMGYPNTATEDFLRRFHATYGHLPQQVRRSWKWSPLKELAPRQTQLPI